MDSAKHMASTDVRRAAALGTILALVAALLLPHGAFAKTDCPGNFAGGTEPLLVNTRLSTQTVSICYQAFAVLHSGLSRTPLWSAEHLTRSRLSEASNTRRVNTFHADEALPPGYRSELSDYVRSGYDRGHMSPSGDMPNAGSQGESFSLANVVPQAPKLNRGLWEGVEAAVRSLAKEDGEVFVVTGPVFAGANMQALQGRVLIPTSVWKAVYDPAAGAAGVYIADNSDDAVVQSISVAQLRNLVGIDPFPNLSAPTKDRLMSLPVPTPYHRRYRH